MKAYQRKRVASVKEGAEAGNARQVKNTISDEKHKIQGYFLTRMEGADKDFHIVSVSAVINGQQYTLLDSNNDKGEVTPGVIGKHAFKTPDNETYTLYAVAEKDHFTSLQGVDSLYLALDKAPVILHSSKDNELTINAYNIKAFPNYIGTALDLNKMNSRISYMIKSDTLKHADILSFEEAWDKKIRDKLIAGFKKEYPYSYSPIPRHSYLKPLYSGLLILSKYPIVKKYFLNYQDHQRLVNADYFSNKGAAFVRIKKGGRFYNIIATHVQSGGDKKAIAARHEEFSLIRKHIINNRDLNISSSNPLILVGDLNTDFYEKSDFSILKDALSLDDQWVGNGINENPKYSNDSDLNLMISPKETAKSLIDYIIPVSHYLAPSKVTEQVTVLRALDDPRMYEPSKNVSLYHYGDIELSDHFMLQARFVF
ncbi:endonuclease/exonuclease/phosphatase family protein [Candidatus Sororendozoicomonas aggregata]|uniref:endonuclease/exonuclease/phosphatase family protein n=1 Tax=Candidatus Sororendozoicomonas aggregata TaxID=3073239 RepID=UPI002ED01A69